MRPRLPSMTLEPRAGYKRRFTVREFCGAAVLLPPAFAALAGNRRRRLLDGRALERVMLAVTEVNGCPACSWAHTQLALREGMTGEEISRLLSGDGDTVPADEAAGVLVAQHYADSRGRPDRAAYDAVVQRYGRGRARLHPRLRAGDAGGGGAGAAHGSRARARAVGRGWCLAASRRQLTPSGAVARQPGAAAQARARPTSAYWPLGWARNRGSLPRRTAPPAAPVTPLTTTAWPSA